jgi:beta-glucanase (GH16 family)
MTRLDSWKLALGLSLLVSTPSSGCTDGSSGGGGTAGGAAAAGATSTTVPSGGGGSAPADGGGGDGGHATTAPSGEPMPVGDLAGWRQIFADDFVTDVALGDFPDAVSERWSAYADGWTDTSGNGTYDPSQVISIHGGVMDLFLHTAGGVHLVSAPVPKLPGAVGSGGGLLYGRYAIRFRADPVAGYKTAWLLWPDSEDWPQDGEIDFPEGDLDGTISAFMHWQGGTSGSDQDAYSSAATYSEWHTAVTEWTATACRFILDGTVLGTSTSRIPNTPMHWVIQTATWLGGTPPADDVSGHVEIDWVVVWEPS